MNLCRTDLRHHRATAGSAVGVDLQLARMKRTPEVRVEARLPRGHRRLQPQNHLPTALHCTRSSTRGIPSRVAGVASPQRGSLGCRWSHRNAGGKADIHRTAGAAAFGARRRSFLVAESPCALLSASIESAQNKCASAAVSAFLRAHLFEEEAQHLATGIGPLGIGVRTRGLAARPGVARAVHQPVLGDRLPGV